MGDQDEPADEAAGAPEGAPTPADQTWGPPRPLPGQSPPPSATGAGRGAPWHSPPDFQFRGPPPPQPVYTFGPPPPVRRRRTGRIVVAILAGLLVVAGMAAGGRWLWDRVRGTVATQQAVDDYLDGEGGTPFSDPDAGFSAEFPAEPERERSTETNPDGLEVHLRSYAVATSRAEFVVFVVDVPPGATADLEAAAGAGILAVGPDATLLSSTNTTFRDLPAIETVFLADDVYVRALTVATPSRVLSIAVSSRTNPPPGFERFRDSVRLSP